MLSPIQDGASKVLSPVRDITNWVSTTLKAKSENAHYEAEAATLRKELALDRYAQSSFTRDQQLLKLDRTDSLSQYGLLSANVVGRDEVLWYQDITIDKGSDDGVRDHDPVIGQDGLVGEVTTVTGGSSIVTLITNPKFAAGATILGTAGVSGLLQPEVADPSTLQLNDLLPDESSQVQANQTVVTSGFGDGTGSAIESYFPRGIPIGQISTQDPQTSITDSQSVQVTPFVDVTELSAVQVLTKPHTNS